MQNYINSLQNYHLLKGIRSNLYKCFLPQAWYIGTHDAVSGFLHPEGVYDDPNAGTLREQIYLRLRYHFQFSNELNLFGDVDHHVKFSINIFQNNLKEVYFGHLANLFSVSTVDACFSISGKAYLGGIKDDENRWNITGHPDRLVKVDKNALELLAKLYDEPGSPALHARLPIVHSQQVIAVLRKFAAEPHRFSDTKTQFISTDMWNETKAQNEGTIKRVTTFVNSMVEFIFSGPHIHIANPLNKTPRSICKLNSDYDPIDLTVVPDDYIPRTNYVIGIDLISYLKKIPSVPWSDNNKITDFYRLSVRKMLSQSGERTLIGTIIPPGAAHIFACFSTVYNELDSLLRVAGAYMSLPFDFFVKTMGKSNFLDDTAKQLPVLDSNKFEPRIKLRVICLNCLTIHYGELWKECWDEAFRQECWAKDDPRLDNAKFANLTPKWQRNCAFRTDYERRQALIETDVLASMALNLTLDELCSIYRIQFPVLRQNENDTWYDQNGRIVFTCSKGLPGVGFSRPEWNEIKDMKNGTVSRTIIDDTMPGGPRERTITYVAPFDKCDREKDYEIAWKEFEKRLKGDK
jgi:hypothetical protein